MPTEIVNGLTDDQVALIGCFVALLVTGTMMSLSFYIGRGSRGESSRSEREKADVIPLTIPVAAIANSGRERPQSAHRDAA